MRNLGIITNRNNPISEHIAIEIDFMNHKGTTDVKYTEQAYYEDIQSFYDIIMIVSSFWECPTQLFDDYIQYENLIRQLSCHQKNFYIIGTTNFHCPTEQIKATFDLKEKIEARGGNVSLQLFSKDDTALAIAHHLFKDITTQKNKSAITPVKKLSIRRHLINHLRAFYQEKSSMTKAV